MTILTVVKSHVPAIGYFFKNGKHAPFIGGKYVTDIAEEIAEFKAEIGNYLDTRSNHPHLYFDPQEKEIDTNAPTPLELIKQQMYAQARKDLAEEQARATNGAVNVSTSEAGNSALSFNSTAKLDGLDGVTSSTVTLISPPDQPTLVPPISTAQAAMLAKLKAGTTSASQV